MTPYNHLSSVDILSYFITYRMVDFSFSIETKTLRAKKHLYA
ncbi:hypothetical protein B4129_3333 [Bacillus safensis]|nr:hypothetical protein B4129_3333 [Bacillus safensis]